MPKGTFRFSKQWAIQADHDEVEVGQIIEVQTQSGPKKCRVTDIVVRTRKDGGVYDLLFTRDV